MLGKKEEKFKNLNISRTKKSVLAEIENIFRNFKGLSFGEI